MILGRKKLAWAATLALLGGLVILAFDVWWPPYLLRQAEDAVAQKDFDHAESILRRLISHSPNNARARFLLAQVLRLLHHPDQAEESLRKALQMGYPTQEGERELALDEAAIQFRPPLTMTLRKLSEENPNDLDLLEALARGYASIRDWRQAESYFSRLIERQPENVEWFWKRGQARQYVAVETGEGHNLAADDFREVVRRVPDHWEARLRLAQCLLSNAQMTEAKDELWWCHQSDPKRVEPLIGLANCAWEEQDWDRANELLTQALALQWNSVIALAMKGDLHLLHQQYPEAIPYFQKVLVLDPANKAAHLKLAQAYRTSGRLAEAKNQEDAFQQLKGDKEKDARGPSRP